MKNAIKYYALSSMYNAAIMLSSGTVMQIFMTNAGVSKQLIGIYASVVSMISIAVHLLFAKRADEIKNYQKVTTKTLLLIGICCLGFLPPCLLQSPDAVLGAMHCIVIPVGILQSLVTAAYAVMGYKLPYYIMDIRQYGRIAATSGTIINACCTALSLLLSACIERFDQMRVMLAAFVLSAVLMLLAAVVNRSYEMHEPAASQTQSTGTIKAMISLLRNRDFSVLLLPNFLRGISIGVISVLAVICLELGYTDQTASSLVTVTYLACFLGCAIYSLLSKHMSEGMIGLLGALLLLPLGFTWAFGDRMFLVLAFLTIFGRTFIDYAVPARIYKMIQPEIACVYQAGRMLVTTAGMAVSTAVSGFLMEADLTVLLLFIGIGSQFCSSLVYLLYRRKR